MSSHFAIKPPLHRERESRQLCKWGIFSCLPDAGFRVEWAWETIDMRQARQIIILGSGSTAFAAALRAQAKGALPIMIEKSVLGGTCINWGCVPSKTLIHAALYRHQAEIGARI